MNIDKENLAVAAVMESLSVTGILKPFIKTGDKEPLWDGNIYIYSNEQNKKDGVKRIPVQVKGKLSNNFEKDTIKYPIEIKDLKSYLLDGGLIYFVVYVSKDGRQKQIYYSALHPVKLRRILDNARGKKKTSFELKKFPEDNEEKEAIFLNLSDDIKKQTSFIHKDLPSIKESLTSNQLESISVSYTHRGNQTPDILRLAVQNELCIYGNFKCNNFLAYLPVPLNGTLTKIRTGDIKSLITVKNKSYYRSFRRIISKDNDELLIGNSLSLKINHCCKTTNVNISPTLILKDALIDLPFILDMVENEQIEFDGRKFPLHGIKQSIILERIDGIKTSLEYCRKIGHLFNTLRLNTDIDLEKMKSEDWVKTRILYETLIEGRSTSELTNIPHDRIGRLQYLNTKLLIRFIPAEKNGEYFISDFFHDDSIKLFLDDGTKEIPVPRFMLMNVQDFQEVLNIDYEEIIKSFIEYSNSPLFSNLATILLYRMILAYDQNEDKRKDILENARLFASAIISKITKDQDFVLARLNQIQIEKRFRPLNEQEKDELISYIEKPFHQNQDIDYVIRVSSCLLLEDTKQASEYYKRMNKELQKKFSKNYPVCHFWKR